MQHSVLKKYFIDDLPSSMILKIEFEKSISILEYHPRTRLSYREKFTIALKENGFVALADYLMQEINYDEFSTRAKKEQENRPANIFVLEDKLKILKSKQINERQHYLSKIERVKHRHIKEINDLKSKQNLELTKLEQQNKSNLQSIQKEIDELQHKIRLETDKEYAEKYYAEQKRIQEEKEKKELEKKFINSFGLSFVDNSHRDMLFLILKKLSGKERLSEEDTIWLNTKGKKYFYKENEIYKTYHKIEAEYYVKLFNQNKDIWNAVNACSHFRKARLAQKAESLFGDILNKKFQNKRLKSAFFTTFGGVMRDLSKFHEGVKLAEQSYNLSPNDYRPCTLLGALYFEIGEYGKGQEWFNRAEELGAPEKNADAEIKAIYHKADKVGKEKIKAHLLSQDPIRYAWLNKGNL
ncbi:hypothetical protein [Moraxella boevrei]|uniref:hypothetical protein n=1 Tax=Faucicola boevrei TaxID=346665 RepID=UPI00373513D7